MTVVVLSQKRAVYEAISRCTSEGILDKDAAVQYLIGLYDADKFLIKSDAKRATESSRKSYIKSLLSNYLKKDNISAVNISINATVALEDNSCPEDGDTIDNLKRMGVSTGIFPTRIAVNNNSHTSTDWLRNIDMIIFRFPSRKKDGSYDVNITEFSSKIFNSLNSNGWCVVFAYGSIENKLRPFEFAAELKNTGLHLVDVVSISRPWWGGKRSDTHLALSYEHVFLFCKSDKWYLDRTSIFPLLVGDKYENTSCPGNAWDLSNYNPAVNYPADLATAIMKMVCLLPGSVILDPFMGGSSGIEAAVECGHSFIGYEVDTDRYNKYSKVLKKVQKLIEDRDADHERTEA